MLSWLIKKGLVVKSSVDWIYILPYYFCLVHAIYYFYLTKINLFIYFYSISQPSFWKTKKKSFSVVIYVCCTEYFFPRIAFSSILRFVPKIFLVANHGGNLCLISQFQENVSSFNSLANALNYCFTQS